MSAMVVRSWRNATIKDQVKGLSAEVLRCCGAVTQGQVKELSGFSWAQTSQQVHG
jgi:hypothetical protein